MIIILPVLLPQLYTDNIFSIIMSNAQVMWVPQKYLLWAYAEDMDLVFCSHRHCSFKFCGK